MPMKAAAGWFVVNNPILPKGDLGTETDTKKFKTGDGTTKWNALPYGPAVTGAKGGNAALTSLLAQLAALGIITDSTT